MILSILSDGSILVDNVQYRAHAGRVWIVGEGGRLELAFNGLRLRRDERLVEAVLRGLAGARGTPPLGVGHILALVFAVVYVAALIAQR